MTSHLVTLDYQDFDLAPSDRRLKLTLEGFQGHPDFVQVDFVLGGDRHHPFALYLAGGRDGLR